MTEKRTDSKINAWFETGGQMNVARSDKEKYEEHFPYIKHDQNRKVSYFALMMLFALIVLIVFIGWNFMGGGAFQGNNMFRETMAARTATAEASGTFPSTSASVVSPAPDVALIASPVSFPGVVRSISTPIATATATATATSTATATATFTPSVIPTATSTPPSSGEVSELTIRLGWYNPGSLAHCDPANHGLACQSLSGDPNQSWFLYAGRAAACPSDFPLASWVVVPELDLALQCMETHDYAVCDYSTMICDVLAINNGPVVEWPNEYPARLYR